MPRVVLCQKHHVRNKVDDQVEAELAIVPHIESDQSFSARWMEERGESQIGSHVCCGQKIEHRPGTIWKFFRRTCSTGKANVARCKQVQNVVIEVEDAWVDRPGERFNCAALLGEGLARAEGRWGHDRIQPYADRERAARRTRIGMWSD